MSREPLTIYECPECGRVMDFDADHVAQTGFCRGRAVPVRVFREEDVRPLREFVESIATKGCRVNHQGRRNWTCRHERDSAATALTTGAQTDYDERWGVEPGTQTRAWTEKVAAGTQLCDGCRAADALGRSQRQEEQR